jgi:Group II intron, maturase-specific domain/Reverse transcriptase (RNA-dependent DNA polymerase)
MESNVFPTQLWVLTASIGASCRGSSAQYIAQGFGSVIDLDLEKFFDRVNHDKLMGQIAKRVEDKRLLKLVRAFLNAGVMEIGLVSPSVEGTPQGGPLSRRAKGVSIKTTMEELARYMLGWRGYFGFCETPEELIALTRWVRLRLRAAFWRQWKTPRRRRAALIALGVSGQLRNTAGSGRGPWHIARSKALSVGLSNAHFKSLGLPSLIDAR